MHGRAPTTSRGWAVDPAPARAAGVVVLGAAAVAALALAVDAAVAPREPAPRRRRKRAGRSRREARDLHAASAMLAGSVLLDSLVEHYRGGFENPGMYTPLVVSAVELAAGIDGATGRRLPGPARLGAHGLSTVVGALGVAFHTYNVLRRPGGLSWLNAFYAAPIGAPAALSLAGLVGAAAEQVDAQPARAATLLGLPAGRLLSALGAGGMMGTMGEAGLLHFRGAFQNPFMLLPVSLPPVAAALLGKAAVEDERPRDRPLTRAWLWLTSAMGWAGVGFHAFGVSRAMGGWRNWRQNVVDGPPLPAPPSFSALAIAGLAALRLRDREDG